jgi:hypothetical protein
MYVQSTDGKKLEDLPKMDDPHDNCQHWLRKPKCDEPDPNRILRKKLQKLFGKS